MLMSWNTPFKLNGQSWLIIFSSLNVVSFLFSQRGVRFVHSRF
ncbi:hypothetical protein LINGRAHAP2_LOCUS23104 [Linum grandiflorum]